MRVELWRMWIRAEHDIFVARQRGREVAAALGIEHQDQIRVATALSEVGRAMLAHAGDAEVRFVADTAEVPVLRIEVLVPAGTPIGDLAPALEGPSRLVELTVGERAGGTLVSLSRRLPASAPPPDHTFVQAVIERLARSEPTTALGELAVQNQNLLTALTELQAQRDELLRRGAELEETNRGVLALYRQLSEELEETNRGVVALYGELDKRSAQLRMANEAKSRFLANVSHELRAPVTAILGLARLLVDTGDDLNPDQAQQVGLIRSSAVDLLILVNDLLDLAKAESGRLEPRWTEVTLSKVFAHLEGTLSPLAESPVSLVVEPADVPPLVTDETLLTRVLRNLVTNGLKFTESGTVRLAARWRPAHSTVELTVADTGAGIAEEHLEQIFEEFYQVPGPRRAAGTGLGLPYARRLAEVLGGSLTVRSQPGEGSVFTVIVPRIPPPEPQGTRDAPDETALPETAARVPYVLVVDDDAAFRAVVVAALRNEAEQLGEAVDGREALSLIARRTPDAIFLDLRMPHVTGRDVLGALASDERWKSIPVVVVSAAVPDASLAGAAAVLAKDAATPEALRMALRVALTGVRPL